MLKNRPTPRPKQQRLLKEPKPAFGGALLKGNPRTARPLNTKRPVHLVLKSKMATGSRSMLRPQFADRIRQTIERQARDCGVKIYRYSNNGNHLHLIVKLHSIALYRKFIRSVTGVLARIVLRAEKACGKLQAGEKFWQVRPFTRLALWGKDYARLARYLVLNNLEAIGFIPHQSRSRGAKRVEIFTIKIEPEPLG